MAEKKRGRPPGVMLVKIYCVQKMSGYEGNNFHDIPQKEAEYLLKKFPEHFKKPIDAKKDIKADAENLIGRAKDEAAKLLDEADAAIKAEPIQT
uniref:Uncharacterized protein n=1 Tax=viral metagenome TaxID=1070528 RepID=A0A6M3KU93_9ZZZZ